MQDMKREANTNYSQILAKAQTILQDRQQSYGEASELHEAIARRWTAVLSERLSGEALSGYEVARMMAEMKAARMDLNGWHEDSLIDQINYLVIAYSIASKLGDDKSSG